jgi:hemin uptake protein HemP
MLPSPAQPTLVVVQTADAPRHRVDSAQLLRGQEVIEILHGDQRYQLRLTREKKLILTK